ncbi:MAG TPA: hypothetical protein VJ276_21130 [Thermoanaerobaculia bacterium]|nr:hypothetical protein [Thermoanaerobaculia bacterium]
MLLLFPFLFTLAADPAATTPCAQFDMQLAHTYGFRPSQLDAAAQKRKSAELDAVWSAVNRNPAVLVPCLEAALSRPTDDGFFLMDGSQLLVTVDSSPKAKQLLLHALERVPLDEVDLRSWVESAAKLGLDGLDTSTLGRRWLAYPKADYYLAGHGAYHVDRENGAMFLFGALDERFATPALIELARTARGEQKEIAVWLLMSQATPEALQALAQLDLGGLSDKAVRSVKALLAEPALIEPRKPPQTSREQFVSAFTALLSGDPAPFDQLVASVPDGERDLVAVATPADLDLLRKVRRYYIAQGNQHAIEYYNQFSLILMTLVWKPRPPAALPLR